MAFTSGKMGLRIWNLLTDLYDHAQLADNWAKVDYHDHSPGKGVLIPGEGIADEAITANHIAPGAISVFSLENGSVSLANLAAALQAQLVPTGLISPYAGTTVPSSDWLMCDGTEQAIDTYSDLAVLLGTTYGSLTDGAGAAGTTHFRTPDLRGRVPVGVDGAAARLTASDALGNAGGVQVVTLSSAQVPNHGHDVKNAFNAQLIESATTASPAGGSGYNGALWTNSPGLVSTFDAVDTTGGGGSHNNMQPYQVVNYIIKV